MSTLTLIVLSLLFLSISAQSLPRSTFSTSLTCEQRCVPDGKGQVQLNNSCLAGDFDKFCTPVRCSCPTPPQRVAIRCVNDACLSNFRRRVARVRFSNFNPDFVYFVNYTVRGTVYDKEEKKPGSCKVLLAGTYRPRRRGVVVTNAVARKVVDAVLQALIGLGAGKRVSCGIRFRRAAQRAADKVFETEAGGSVRMDVPEEGGTGRMAVSRVDIAKSASV